MWFGWLFLVLIGAEFWLLVKIGTIVGAFTTIIMLIIAGMLGMSVLRRQGFSTLMRFQQRLDSGDSPAAEMLDGMLLALTGGLLMIPGFITDVMALLLLLPPLRRYLVKRWLKRSLLQQSRRAAGTAHTNVIEGEYRRED
jgi:UPF0716 protein FxsA